MSKTILWRIKSSLETLNIDVFETETVRILNEDSFLCEI